MGYGAPVTAPMEIPPEVYFSPLAPPKPELPGLPRIEDAGVTGLRLQGTLAKALPGIKEAGSMTNEKQLEAAKLARDIGIVFDISKGQQARSKAIARKKNRDAQRAATPKTKSQSRTASAKSRRNTRREKAISYNAAYKYGYDPNQSMR